MSREAQALPAARAIDAALRKITETLASELAQPSSAVPQWSEFEWNLAEAVAAMHGISPLLSRTLRWRGPPGWTQFLEEQRSHTLSRHLRIEALLHTIAAQARNQGVGVIALKGAALHTLGLYEGGDRPMADVDLLVRPDDAGNAARMLVSLEYQECCTGWRERTFVPVGVQAAAGLGEHAENAIKIELHERICKGLPSRITDISDFMFPSHRQPGLGLYPSSAALMLHLLLHAAASMAARTLRMIQLHDLALLLPHMTADDWHEILEYRAGTPLWWAMPPLELLSRYYPARFPARIAAALRSDCPWHLARLSGRRLLSDVSFSHLWVDAFPGIEWSRSISEMLEYALARIRPNRQVMAMRGVLSATEAWAADEQWSKLSQKRRMLAWLTSRPTRPTTMYVVRTALSASRD